MKVVTVASDLTNKGFIDFLNPSCNFYGLDAVVLEYDDVFFSNRVKDALLSSFLEGVSDDEIIFFTDATDAVFVAKEAEILAKFKAFNSPLVFSAEINCWPDRDLEKDYPAPSVHFKYLNSGGFIGNAGFIKQLYQKYPIFDASYNPRFFWSNQYYWNTVYKAEWPKIKLDHYGEIFYNTAISVTHIDELNRQLADPAEVSVMFDREKFRLDQEICFSDGRVKSYLTDSLPCHIHFPGTISKLLMEEGYFDVLKAPFKQ